MPKKLERGDLIDSSGLLGYVQKLKNERGPFALSLPWPASSSSTLSSFSRFSTKSGPISVRSVIRTKNKTRTSKVGAISKAQKAQNIFLEIFDLFSFRKCRIVPKNVKGGTLWALLTYVLLQNIKKLERGTLLTH